MQLAEKNILVVGGGKSGLAVARFASARGAIVTLNDRCDAAALESHGPELEKRGVRLVFGEHPVEIFMAADLIVVSPGVPETIAPLVPARRRCIPVMGELEFASRFIHERIVAVTGTNGKTTTTTLLGEMLRRSGRKVFVGGNIGNPLIEYASAKEQSDVLVIEVSSFQLDTASTFKADVAVLLNISADHLDRYADFKAYAVSKGKLLANQAAGDTAVINGMDREVIRLAADTPARTWPFQHAGRNGRGMKIGASIHADRITIRTGRGEPLRLDLKQAALTGAHNRENIAAAALAALAAGGTAAGIQSAINRFAGLAHRLETVTIRNGVLYVDDSKGTNVDAVARALEAMQRPTVLIMGGRGKGGDYTVLRPQLRKTVKQLILIGEAARAIETQLDSAAPTSIAENMAQAVRQAAAAAAPGDAVLLSPACSSFDMYSSYAQRGDDFCKQVRELK